jgi:hypothetical protein
MELVDNGHNRLSTRGAQKGQPTSVPSRTHSSLPRMVRSPQRAWVDFPPKLVIYIRQVSVGMVTGREWNATAAIEARAAVFFRLGSHFPLDAHGFSPEFCGREVIFTWRKAE